MGIVVVEVAMSRDLVESSVVGGWAEAADSVCVGVEVIMITGSAGG